MKATWLGSVFRYTCPKCRSFKMFTTPFNIKQPLEMHERCGKCDQRFAPEPGFYFGAMFLSYILSAWLLLLTALLLVFYFKWTVENAMLVVIAIGALSYFKLLRFSRSLYIHIVVGYDKEAATRAQ